VEVAMTAMAMRQPLVARGRRALLLSAAVLALVAACYVCGPFVTLWRITRALDRDDLVALRGVIDWSAVRQGLKDDVTEGLIGMPQRTLVASNTLPPFGAGFLSGIAGTAIERAVTPEGLRQAADLLDPRPGPGVGVPLPTIVQAGFSSPTQFDIRVRVPCQDVDEGPLHLRLAFRTGLWQVVRVWVPQDLMDRAAARI
jgi:hypothetical protein